MAKAAFLAFRNGLTDTETAGKLLATQTLYGLYVLGVFISGQWYALRALLYGLYIATSTYSVGRVRTAHRARMRIAHNHLVSGSVCLYHHASSHVLARSRAVRTRSSYKKLFCLSVTMRLTDCYMEETIVVSISLCATDLHAYVRVRATSKLAIHLGTYCS